MANNTGVKITKGNVQEVIEGLRILAGVEVLVGFPEDTTNRNDKDGITNAALAYIHDQGAPEAHIPQREFMKPAIEENKDKITLGLSGAMRQAMRGDPVKLEMALHAVGLLAKLAIQKKINEGIPPPLSERTLKDRARRGRKGAQMELDRRAKGLDPLIGMALAKPLIDTGQMRNAVNYVIRSRRKRR